MLTGTTLVVLGGFGLYLLSCAALVWLCNRSQNKQLGFQGESRFGPLAFKVGTRPDLRSQVDGPKPIDTQNESEAERPSQHRASDGERS
jgi:hypothetical protein